MRAGPPAEPEIDIQAASNAPGIPGEDEIRAWIGRAIAGAGRCAGELAVRIVDAEEMRGLNREFRGKDKATNVLSFPAGNIDGLPPEAGLALGDLVICAPVLESEALEQGKPLGDHWAHILVHGTLHLLGFDHESPVDADEMEALETTILAACGIPDPYSER